MKNSFTLTKLDETKIILKPYKEKVKKADSAKGKHSGIE